MVAPATRERIAEIVQEMGYTPSASAQSLRSGPQNIFGLLLSPELMEIGDELISSTILSRLIRDAANEGYYIIPEPLNPEIFEKHARPASVAQGRISGCFVLGDLCEDALGDIAGWGVPVCMLGEIGAGMTSLPSVDFDFAAGATEVVQYLSALGHRHIALVHGDMHYGANQGKKAGHLAGLSAFGLPVDESLICEVAHDQQNFTGGYRATVQMLKQSNPPTAIHYVNDWYAIGGLAAALECGRKVPQDLSIVGCDDSFLARQSTPALSSVAYDYAALTRSALDILVRLVGGQRVAEPKVLLRPHLVWRDSCAPHHSKPAAPAARPKTA